jgi:hypothetical protein
MKWSFSNSLLTIAACAPAVSSEPAILNCLVEQICDLLWFPTGGGKTEAYPGLAAFTLALRCLLARRTDRVEFLITVVVSASCHAIHCVCWRSSNFVVLLVSLPPANSCVLPNIRRTAEWANDRLVYTESAMVREPERGVVLGDAQHQLRQLPVAFENTPTSLKLLIIYACTIHTLIKKYLVLSTDFKHILGYTLHRFGLWLYYLK